MRTTTARRLAVALALIGLALPGLWTLPDWQHEATAKKARTGGPAVAHHSGGKLIRGYRGELPKPAAYLPHPHAAEPTVGLLEDGTAFYVAADLDSEILPNQVHVLRTTDEGKSWEDVSPSLGPQRRHVVTLDPYVYVDKYTDRVYTIDLTVACAVLSYSDDAGESWISNPLGCGRPGNDHQTLFSGPPAVSPTVGYDSIVYYCWNDVASSSCGKSLDGGITWSATGSPAFTGVATGEGAEQGDFCGGLHGHGHVGPDGAVYVPRVYCGAPMVAISHDEGATWNTVRVSGLSGTGHDASIASDKKGNLYYTWTGPKLLPYLVYSRDGGETWSRPLMIGVPGLKEANFPTLDAEAPGKVAVAYMASKNVIISRDDEGEERRDYAVATWNGYITMSVDLFAKNPTFLTAAINHPSDPLDRARCGPGRCGRIFDFLDVEIGPDGTPWGAFVDACIDLCAEPVGIVDQGDQGLVGRLIGGPSLR